MNYSARDYQARCWAYGINAGPIDGLWGSKTQEAVRQLMVLKKVDKAEKVFHPSGLHRVHMHWTAGAYGDIAYERRAYHLIVLENGRVVMGDLAPEANADTSDGIYAAHTRACNTGAIGISVDCMAGANQSPFRVGEYPMTKRQLDGLVCAVADLCDTYDIPVSRYSTLTHKEVQTTLGVRQRWKWDITWLPGMSKPGDPIQVGDKIRDMIRKEM